DDQAVGAARAHAASPSSARAARSTASAPSNTTSPIAIAGVCRTPAAAADAVAASSAAATEPRPSACTTARGCISHAAAAITIVSSSSARPPANACRKAASANATARPICFAYVAATIAARMSWSAQSAGQRSGWTCCESAARSIADWRAVASPLCLRPPSPASRIGTHSGATGSSAITRSAARYASGLPRSNQKTGCTVAWRVARLPVDQPAVRCACGLHHALGQRRVPVHHTCDLRIAALQRAHVDELLDQLGRLRADDVAAEQLAVSAVADDLHQAGAIAVDGSGTDGAVRHSADDDVVAGVLRLLLGEAERGDVRHAEGRARDVDVRDRMRRVPRDVLGGDDALVGGLVRERRAGDDVADRPNPSRRRAQRAVNDEQPSAVDLHAGIVEAETLDVGPAAGGNDQVV